MSAFASPVQPKHRSIVCGDSAYKPELLRMLRRADGGIEIGPIRDRRNAYVYRSPESLDAAAASPGPRARALEQNRPQEMLRQIAAQ